MVTVHSDAKLALTVVDDDIEVRCDDVSHTCGAEEMSALLADVRTYRFDDLYCRETGRVA
jgi:hypothetical protein